jgi:hypothetical protein
MFDANPNLLDQAVFWTWMWTWYSWCLNVAEMVGLAVVVVIGLFNLMFLGTDRQPL